MESISSCRVIVVSERTGLDLRCVYDHSSDTRNTGSFYRRLPGLYPGPNGLSGPHACLSRTPSLTSRKQPTQSSVTAPRETRESAPSPETLPDVSREEGSSSDEPEDDKENQARSQRPAGPSPLLEHMVMKLTKTPQPPDGAATPGSRATAHRRWTVGSSFRRESEAFRIARGGHRVTRRSGTREDGREVDGAGAVARRWRGRGGGRRVNNPGRNTYHEPSFERVNGFRVEVPSAQVTDSP